MKDYVNTEKPSALHRFWRKHADDCRFWAMIALVILFSSVFGGW